MPGQLKDGTTNGASPIVTSIESVPITEERKPFVQPEDDERLPHAGVARANIAATYEKPYGTTEGGWAARREDKTVSEVPRQWLRT